VEYTQLQDTGESCAEGRTRVQGRTARRAARTGLGLADASSLEREEGVHPAGQTCAKTSLTGSARNSAEASHGLRGH
jgi:hypothetical protein